MTLAVHTAAKGTACPTYIEHHVCHTLLQEELRVGVGLVVGSLQHTYIHKRSRAFMLVL
jgi:hypothetical protein